MMAVLPFSYTEGDIQHYTVKGGAQLRSRRLTWTLPRFELRVDVVADEDGTPVDVIWKLWERQHLIGYSTKDFPSEAVGEALDLLTDLEVLEVPLALSEWRSEARARVATVFSPLRIL